MPFFGLNPVEDQNAQDTAAQNPYVPKPETPGFFDNISGGIGQGLESSYLSASNVAGDAFDPIVRATMNPDNVQSFEDFRSDVKSLITKPIDPVTTGALGKIGGMVAGGALTAAFGAPEGPAGVAAAFGITGYKDAKLGYQAQGVDDTTATEAAIPTGIQQAAMGFLPFGVGSTVLQRAGAGALGNIGLGVLSRELTSKVLEDHGYHDLAVQSKPLDGMAMLSEGLLGGFIGAGHVANEPIKADITPEQKLNNIDSLLPSDVDGALSMNSIGQHEVDSAPGIPADIESRNAHTDMMDTNTPNVLAGEDVTVPDSMLGASFVPKPEAPEITQAFDDAQKEAGIPEAEEAAQQGEEDGEPQDTPLNADDEPEPSTETNDQTAASDEPTSNENEAEPEGDASDYNTKLAQDILAEKPETQVPTSIEKDAEGNDQLQSLSGDEALQQADEEAAKNDELDNMVQAAINCALRFGGME